MPMGIVAITIQTTNRKDGSRNLPRTKEEIELTAKILTSVQK